ncbi:SdpI family protein [Flavobacterium sp. MFBS3-15]|uniref:SdpI family protein n=1 Tax=Flavobacterium sp. MFBS3-15 TaxID=2989816 RepID=UPI0022366418|nr:SdpI family protein [Flavobacterium sp. MFBS3-15]MCW4469134.1 SdpI family protein [Flavobacterium sp. MFBS3-15]
MEEFVDNIFFVSLMCGVVFLVASAIMHFFPPKEINYLYGYRTPASMKTQERWDFAQHYSTKQMFKAAMGLIALSFTGYFFDLPTTVNVSIGLALIVLSAFYMFITTEKAIKSKFNEMP